MNGSFFESAAIQWYTNCTMKYPYLSAIVINQKQTKANTPLSSGMVCRAVRSRDCLLGQSSDFSSKSSLSNGVAVAKVEGGEGGNDQSLLQAAAQGQRKSQKRAQTLKKGGEQLARSA